MHRCLILLSVVFFLASVNISHADVIADDEDGCDGKSAGDDCTDSGNSGTCALEECETEPCDLTCDTSASTDSGTTSCSLVGRVKNGPFISFASLLGGLSILWMLRRKKT